MLLLTSCSKNDTTVIDKTNNELGTVTEANIENNIGNEKKIDVDLDTEGSFNKTLTKIGDNSNNNSNNNNN